MVRKGYAVVYEGKSGEFGDSLVQLKEAEAYAKRYKLGLWAQQTETPMQYKKKTN